MTEPAELTADPRSAEVDRWWTRVLPDAASTLPIDGEPTVALRRHRVPEPPVQWVVVLDVPRREGARREVKRLIAELTNEARGLVFTAPSDDPAPTRASGPPPPLTSREREVLVHLGRGEPAKGIARHLGISVHTCRGYIKSLHTKLGVRSQVEALVRAQALGLL